MRTCLFENLKNTKYLYVLGESIVLSRLMILLIRFLFIIKKIVKNMKNHFDFFTTESYDRVNVSHRI